MPRLQLPGAKCRDEEAKRFARDAVQGERWVGNERTMLRTHGRGT